MTLPLGDEAEVLLSIITRRKSIITYLLITINILVFASLKLYPNILGVMTYEDAVYILGSRPADVLSLPSFWRVFTSMFIHADTLHLLGNMIFLFVFGRAVEKALGSFKFLVLYILAGLVAHIINTLSIVLLPATALLIDPRVLKGETLTLWAVVSIGASGAISGVMGAYYVLFPRAQLLSIVFYVPLVIPAEVYIAMWFIYQLLLAIMSLTGIATGVAYWAHIGGFIAGIIITVALANPKYISLLRKVYRYLVSGYYFM